MRQDRGPRRSFGAADAASCVDGEAPAAAGGREDGRAAGGAQTDWPPAAGGASKLDGPELPSLLAHGIDSLYVSWFFDRVANELDWDDLVFRREQLRSRRNGGGQEIQVGTESFWLLPFGKKPYSFILANRDFEVRLSEHMQPNCYVQFMSEALWRDGPGRLLGRFMIWAASLGWRPSRPPVVSRVDWAFDFHVPHIDFTGNDIVSRNRAKAQYDDGGKLTGFLIGRGDLVVRLYDKVAEIRAQSDKVWMFEVWGRKTDVWRVEFQGRGPALKQFGMRNPVDVKALQYDFLREIAGKHTTLRRQGADTNRSRWPLHPLWKALRRAIHESPQEGLIRAIDPATSLRWRRHQQVKYLFGCLKGLGALLSIGREDVCSLDDTLKALRILTYKREYDPGQWDADLRDRITRHRYGKW